MSDSSPGPVISKMGLKMGQKSKSPKGEISIEDNAGRIRLRWRYRGVRYPLSLPYDYTSENMHHATVIAAEIKLDMLKGDFDTSLERYKPKKAAPINVVPVKTAASQQKVIYLDKLTDKFTSWTKDVRNINIDHSTDYFDIRNLLRRYSGIPLEGIAGKLAAEKWAVSTYNKRLSLLDGFFSWLLNTGMITINPLVQVTKRREKRKSKNERRRPLNAQEINDFLEAIRKNLFCHKSSPYKHSFYYPFLRFVFLTGVRNAEAIGLRVRHLNFDVKQIEVSEAFARTPKGTNHAARISKGTKTENIRYLLMSEDLYNFLQPLVDGKNPEEFVFLSPRGLSIDDRMLERRIIKPVLIALGIGDRDLYAARHSFGTRAVQQGMVITDVAYLMGHSTVETTIRNYISVNQRTVGLPTI